MPYEVTIRDAEGVLEATFIPELGMVGGSIRHEGEELLAQLGGQDAYARSGSTFALPFLHPWANRLSAWEYGLDDHPVELDPNSPIIHRDGATGLPIHGLLAASPHWQLVDADIGSLTAELDFGAVPEYIEAFPFPHRITYRATAQDATLTVAITVTPTADLPVPISFGFHPYLTLPGSDRRDWMIKLPVTRQALLDEQMIPTGQHVELLAGELNGPLGDRTFDTSYDRLSEASDRPTFVVADERRTIAVEFVDGYPTSQVYAPEKSDFICFEPMTAPINALKSGERLRFAQPGSEFTAVFAISVR
jgi:aldose 1-epimerase